MVPISRRNLPHPKGKGGEAVRRIPHTLLVLKAWDKLEVSGIFSLLRYRKGIHGSMLSFLAAFKAKSFLGI